MSPVEARPGVTLPSINDLIQYQKRNISKAHALYSVRLDNGLNKVQIVCQCGQQFWNTDVNALVDTFLDHVLHENTEHGEYELTCPICNGNFGNKIISSHIESCGKDRDGTTV